MSRFAFEAIDRQGATIRGTIEAPDQASVLDQLVLTGHTPVSIRAVRDQPVFFQRLGSLAGISGFDYVSFLRELGILLKAGLPAERALTTLGTLTADARSSLRIQQIVDAVRGGEPLSQAFGAQVHEAPRHISRLLAAGEASGRLPEITERVATGLTRIRALRARLISDLSYPAVLVVAICVVLWVVFHTVLPRLAPMFQQSGVDLPLATKLLLDLAWFFDTFGWALFMASFAAICGAIYFARNPRVRLAIDRFLITSHALLGIPRAFEAALFCRNLQTVLDGGLSLERALATVRDGIGNRKLRAEIATAQERIREGVKLSHALARFAPDLPPMIVEFSAVGEETGRLAPMMREAADILEHAAQTKLDRLATLLVPVTTLVMGGLVAGLMTGIVGGILAINDLAR